MTTPEQIIAKIEEIEKITGDVDVILPDQPDIKIYFNNTLDSLLEFKQSIIEHFNLPTADPDEGSPGQEDMKG